jgi:hypothetical protein
LIPINIARANLSILGPTDDEGDRKVIGITLNSEQIRTAPADVRRWIEREISHSFGPQSQPADHKSHGERPAACSADEVAALLSRIQGVLPAVNVFFEFGRQGAVLGPSRLEAFRLQDIAYHTRLQSVGQVIACLDIINEALAQIRGDVSATFCGFDREGHCFIPAETQQNILRLWQNVIAGQQLATDGPESIALLSMPESTSGRVNPDGSEMTDKQTIAPVFSEQAAIQT